MDIAIELQNAKERQKEVINQINQLPERRPVLELQQNLAQAQGILEEKQQPLLQELLRLEGDIRTLQRLSRDGDKDGGHRTN